MKCMNACKNYQKMIKDYDELKSRLYADGKTYLFLDEIQEVQGWEKVVNSLASDFDVDIYVTG